jgi:hypothetical protein
MNCSSNARQAYPIPFRETKYLSFYYFILYAGPFRYDNNIYFLELEYFFQSGTDVQRNLLVCSRHI